MIILIDSREKTPLLVTQVGNPLFKGLKFEITGLKTGDYSIKGMDSPKCEHSITIERKSLPDLFMSCGNERERFEREYQRMSEFDHAELVVEHDLSAVFRHPPQLSEMLSKAVYRTIVAWSQRYQVHTWFVPNKNFAERHVFISLNRFWKDRKENGKMEFCKI